jgi:hypothetical protein
VHAEDPSVKLYNLSSSLYLLHAPLGPRRANEQKEGGKISMRRDGPVHAVSWVGLLLAAVSLCLLLFYTSLSAGAIDNDRLNFFPVSVDFVRTAACSHAAFFIAVPRRQTFCHRCWLHARGHGAGV